MEALYQYVWKYRLVSSEGELTDGRPLKIKSPGVLNTAGGPDFSAARLEIDGTQWCGDVEIHVKASDWFAHHHDTDSAYDKVALHVVGVDDAVATRTDGSLLPQYVAVIPGDMYLMYATLTEGLAGVRCGDALRELYPLYVRDWLDTLALERLQRKASDMARIYERIGHDTSRLLFVAVARAFGFGRNGDALEQLAMRVDLNFISRHSDDLRQIEAFIFGLAGMLDAPVPQADDYYLSLCREYRFLRHKYSLESMPWQVWSRTGTRPQNYPHRRLALLCRLLEGGFTLPGELRECCGNTEKMEELFDLEPSEYWKDHFSFGCPRQHSPGTLGKGSARGLIINAVVPAMYMHASMTGDASETERALDMLGELPAERNGIVKCWEGYGIKPGNAFDSQALLQLRKEYCDRNRCADCRLAYLVMKRRSRNPALFNPFAAGI